ncbi:MAG: hypothetical protein OXU20_08530 [Myxococcales bacterium]|nr:hypothetical protein [Myxococcales bacterium]
MATKNLARTIIEGGRARYNKWDRNYSHKEERALTREYFARTREVEDGFEALSIGRRPKVYKGFSDKLGAPRRWLRSQVGRPWDKVRSEIFTRFNPRSLAGQHIIFDHLLQEVVIHGVHDRWHAWRANLYVDRHGILRSEKPQKRPGIRFRYGYGPVDIPEQIRRWEDGRRVGGVAPALYWLIESGRCDGCVRRKRTPCCCPVVEGRHEHGSHVHYRQSHRLTPEEVKVWLTLAQRVQDRLLGARGA